MYVLCLNHGLRGFHGFRGECPCTYPGYLHRLSKNGMFKNFLIDLRKGVLVATVPIQDVGLEEEFQKIRPEISRIVYEDLTKFRRTLGMSSLGHLG